MALESVIDRVAYLTFRVVPVIALAVFFSNLLIQYGIIKKLDFVVSPLTRGARLPRGSGAVIVTSLASGTASYSIMANFYHQGKMGASQVIVTSIMSTFFQVVHHFFTYYLPVVVPILGFFTGMLYASIKVAIGLAMTLSAVLIGRAFLPLPQGRLFGGGEEEEKGHRDKLEESLGSSFKTLKMILPRLYIIYIAVALLLAGGYLQSLGDFAEPLAGVFHLPGEAVTIIALQAFDATSGFVLAGALLNSGGLSPSQTITALLLGTLITLSMTYAKHSLPSKIAFFGTRLGTRIALYNLLLQLFFTLIALIMVVTLL